MDPDHVFDFSNRRRTNGLTVNEREMLESYVLELARIGDVPTHGVTRTMVGANYDRSLLFASLVGPPRQTPAPRSAGGLLSSLFQASQTDIALASSDVAELSFARLAIDALRPGSGLERVAWTHLRRRAHNDANVDIIGPADVALFDREIDRLRPKRVVVFGTWRDFKPFQGSGFDFIAADEPEVQGIGRLDGALVHVVEVVNPDATFSKLRQWLIPRTDLLSEVQQVLFERVCGYPWDGCSVEGSFATMAAWDDWDNEFSPHIRHVEFSFNRSTRHLFMLLACRFSGASGFGWSADGRPLPPALVARRFRIHEVEVRELEK